MIYFVTYDLHQHGRDYEAVAAVLNSADSAVHPMGSVWLIQSSASTSAWRDALRRAGDENDEYFIARISSPMEWASFNLDRVAVAWLEDPTRQW